MKKLILTGLVLMILGLETGTLGATSVAKSTLINELSHNTRMVEKQEKSIKERKHIGKANRKELRIECRRLRDLKREASK